MTISADRLDVIIKRAREVVAVRKSTTPFDEFAAAIVQISSMRGAIRGQEAEELRAGIEQILANTADIDDGYAAQSLANVRKSLSFLLDRTNAQDSLVHLGQPDAKQAIVDAVTDADIAALPPEVRDARLAHEFPHGD